MFKKFIVNMILVCTAVMAAVGPLCADQRLEKVPRRPKVALVLCGGGAKGAAHIGALKVLEEARVPIGLRRRTVSSSTATLSAKMAASVRIRLSSMAVLARTSFSLFSRRIR